jgi:CubicO group peptidase (beta-lactamase class C family)
LEVCMLETVTPEQVGMSTGHLEDVRATMQAFVNDGQYAGIATLIARHGQIVESRCYGQLDIAAHKPLRPDSLFRIYSLTKPITAAAALMLRDDGCFALDDPVAKWLPEFRKFRVARIGAGEVLEFSRLENEITFRHLLTHTSGLGYGFMGGPIEALYAGLLRFSPVNATALSLSEIIQKLPEMPLVAQPGLIWSYSLSYDVLAYLIELISGQPYEVFLRERIFGPLGMPDTSLFVPSDKLDRFGPMYQARGEAAGLSVADAVAGSPFVSSSVGNSAAPCGGGGLVSSMPDYYRFAAMLANGGELDGVRLLSKQTAAQMTSNQLPGSAHGAGGFDGYGLGVGVRLTTDAERGQPAGAFGWGGASGTEVLICPREDMIVMCMTQSWFDMGAGQNLLKMAYAATVT